MASKQNQLVQTLLDQNQQLNATQLANSLGVSVRTVHNYINAVNAQYPDAILSTPTGYRIAPAMAQQMLHQSPNDIPQNAQDRCTYILNRLVQKGGSLNLYDLCDEIYISATTFHGLMGKMRRLTREYDLSLTVSGDTVTLTGSERNKRRLLSGLLYHESASAFTSTDSLQAAFPSIDIEKIRADVMDVLNENPYFINDYSLLNLLLHIAIAINRVQNGCVYTEAPSTMHPLDPQNARLAQELTERLARKLNIRFSAAEQYEMALLLVSRTSMLDYASITPDNIADYIGSDHTEVIMTREQVLASLEEVVAMLGTYDITTIRASMGMYLCCKAIHEQTDVRVLMTGEISDELFGYKYTDFAPSPEAFQQEAKKRVDELYMYDVLRADRCIAVNSIEARVPFGDLDFVKYVMSIDPKLKVNSYHMGKYLLREAFAADRILPEDILWRQKAAFSDAVGHSMVDDLKEYAESLYTDEEYEEKRKQYSFATPFTKESLLYRELFEKYYPGQAEMVKDFWMPNKDWEGCDVKDPSARVLSNYGASGV